MNPHPENCCTIDALIQHPTVFAEQNAQMTVPFSLQIDVDFHKGFKTDFWQLKTLVDFWCMKIVEKEGAELKVFDYQIFLHSFQTERVQ